ncbi:MAG: sulfate ABC transporter ATP-binding protein [Chthoniobacter sp.]
MSIEVQNISRRFGNYTALDQVNLRIEKGELVSLLGPSGSGKTTLLRIIAGLETSDTGRVLLHGQDATEVPVRKRQVGFVFQHYALFRHMNVLNNIAFGLNVRSRGTRPSREEIRERVFSLLKLVQLEGLENRFPTQLSGGQRQRVALARALAIEPKVLLLDEPFGALDAKVRKELRRWLRQLHEELHITSVFVTHDQEEALEVADRVVVMNNARIEQIGTPREIYDHPATPFVNEFLGNVNSLSAHVEEGRVHVGAIDLLAPLEMRDQKDAVGLRAPAQYPARPLEKRQASPRGDRAPHSRRGSDRPVGTAAHRQRGGIRGRGAAHRGAAPRAESGRDGLRHPARRPRFPAGIIPWSS